MSDVRDVLEGVRRQVRPQPGSLERIHAKHEQRERNRKIGATVVALAVALVAVAALAQFLGIGSEHVPAPPGMTLTGSQHVEFPVGMAAASGSIWTISVVNEHTLDRIDPATLTVTPTHLSANFNAHQLIAAAGSIWIVGKHGGLFRVDPTTGETVAHVHGSYWSIAAGLDHVWVSGRSGTIRVDPATNEVTAMFPRECVMSVGGDSVWASCGDSVRRINATTLDVIGRVEGPGRVFEAAGNLWLMTGPDVSEVKNPKNAYTALDRLDPSTGQIVPGSHVVIAKGASSPIPSVDGNDIWFPCSYGVGPDVAMLYRFDAATGRVVESFDLGHDESIGSNSIVFAYGSAWTASGPAGLVRRWTLPTSTSS